MKLATTLALLFVINMLTAQIMHQSITADTLIARMACKTIDCVNTFAINNHFFLKQKTNLGSGQNIYNSNETYKADSSDCTLPDELSAIMSNTGVMEITYATVVKSTYDDLLNAFALKGFHPTLNFTEDDVQYTNYLSTTVEDYKLTTNTKTKYLSGAPCPVYTVTISWAY